MRNKHILKNTDPKKPFKGEDRGGLKSFSVFNAEKRNHNHWGGNDGGSQYNSNSHKPKVPGGEIRKKPIYTKTWATPVESF